MNLASCPDNRAPDRCDARARRMVQVKFVSLPLELPTESPAAEIVSSFPARSFRSLRNVLTRVVGRLVAARPRV